MRKHCFETVRRCETFAGYDFLGDIDTHWHTFGYCVGMMNEFYELKAGETEENVLRYNSPTVLLADLPRANLHTGETVEILVWVSHYGEDLENATLQLCLTADGKTVAESKLSIQSLKRGALKQLACFSFRVPAWENAAALTLCAVLRAGEKLCSNCWELYAFPKAQESQGGNVIVCDGCTVEELVNHMQAGKRVVIFGTKPFASCPTTFQLSIAGRTTGHLATAIAKHPITDSIPHQGFCGKQFEAMLCGGKAAVLDGTPGPHNPIIDIATSYKNAKREALLFEYRIEEGKMLVCTLNLDENDPAASYLKEQILSYAKSDDFNPAVTLTPQSLAQICTENSDAGNEDSNRAVNKNDITAGCHCV